jgi:hypothetical protein
MRGCPRVPTGTLGTQRPAASVATLARGAPGLQRRTRASSGGPDRTSRGGYRGVPPPNVGDTSVAHPTWGVPVTSRQPSPDGALRRPVGVLVQLQAVFAEVAQDLFCGVAGLRFAPAWRRRCSSSEARTSGSARVASDSAIRRSGSSRMYATDSRRESGASTSPDSIIAAKRRTSASHSRSLLPSSMTSHLANLGPAPVRATHASTAGPRRQRPSSPALLVAENHRPAVGAVGDALDRGREKVMHQAEVDTGTRSRRSWAPPPLRPGPDS